MLVEIDTLPPLIQQYIEAGETITLSNHGKIVGEFVMAEKNLNQSYAKGDFSFDLERMQDMMNTEFHEMPKFATDEEFLAWVNS